MVSNQNSRTRQHRARSTGREMEDDVVQRIARLSVVTPTARIVGKDSALCLCAVVRFGACTGFRARVGDFVADAVLGDLSVAFCGEVVPPMRMDASVLGGRRRWRRRRGGRRR